MGGLAGGGGTALLAPANFASPFNGLVQLLPVVSPLASKGFLVTTEGGLAGGGGTTWLALIESLMSSEGAVALWKAFLKAAFL